MRKLFLITIIFLISLLPLASINMSMAQDADEPETDSDVTVDYFSDDESADIQLNLFEVGAWGRIGEIGLLAALGLIAQLLFSFLIVIWIFIAIFAGLKIIRSQGDPEGIKGGMTRLKNLWMGATIGILFFIAVSFIGTFAGVGNIFAWSDNLQDCDCSNAAEGADCYTYLFQMKASLEDENQYTYLCIEETKTGWLAVGK